MHLMSISIKREGNVFGGSANSLNLKTRISCTWIYGTAVDLRGKAVNLISKVSPENLFFINTIANHFLVPKLMFS